MAHWLLKTEPSTFSIDTLRRKKVDQWDGVRNPMAKIYLQTMQVGEECLFYHSSCEPPGIAGLCRVVKPAYPDATQFDPKSKYFDPKATREQPRWFAPDLEFTAKFKRFIPLGELRETAGLEDMALLRRGQRLSVQPVSDEEWKIILGLVT